MEYNKLKNKTDDIIVWLDVNDVGALDSVLRGMITSAQTEGQTETQYGQYWASIRALCGTLPNSPIRKGQPTALPTQVQAVADSVVSRVITAFAAITDIELVLDTIMPMRNTSGNKFETAQEMAEYFGNRVRRLLTDSFKAGNWNGELTDDNITGLALPVKEAKEATE
tara:strand:+ start:674 stop:1177 length:504 start_codon:yes stop_codon:yes gene_type:complete